MFARNKRKFFRLSAHHLLRYKILGQENLTGTLSFIRNISAGGALFHCEEYIKPNTLLKIEIHLPFSPNAVEITAKVARIRALKKMGGFDIAIEFVDLENETSSFLNKKILYAYDKTKGGGMIRTIAIIFLILSILAALVALGGRFNILPQILFKPRVWLEITISLLLFSIAFSLVKNK